MNICIKSVNLWFERHPKAREWAWFFGLWFCGLLTTAFIAYPIKWLMKSL
ncbi:MAG: hypothetical protein WBC26_11305 [Alphaproteobacteria bacterium]|nr:hypothetical protein [Alphaproteobacteria bacterium]